MFGCLEFERWVFEYLHTFPELKNLSLIKDLFKIYDFDFSSERKLLY